MSPRKKTPRLRTPLMDLGITNEHLNAMKDARAKAHAQKKLIESSLTLLRKTREKESVSNQFKELKLAVRTGNFDGLKQVAEQKQLELHLAHPTVHIPKSNYPSKTWRDEFDAAQKRRILRKEASEEEAVLFDGIDKSVQDIALNRGALQKERAKVLSHIKWVTKTRSRHEVISEEGITRFAGNEVRRLRILNSLLKMHRIPPVNIFGKPIKNK